ncbi:MAG: hypothetical protein LLG04_17780 [Parachlamydia sp.]|nr:hypothetical protein [Parachlamydia sp.]
MKAPCLAPVVAVIAAPSVKAAGDAIAPSIKDQTAKCFDERLPNSTDACMGASVDSTDPSLKKFGCV